MEVEGRGRALRSSRPRDSDFYGRMRVIRKEGESVIAVLDAGHPPFDEPWDRWRPDPCWPTPDFPEGWSDLCKYPAVGGRL